MAARKKQPIEEPHVRLGRALGQHLSDDFDAFGAEIIANLRTERPAEYIKLMTAVLSGAIKGTSSAPQITVIERRIVRPPDRDG